MNAPEEFSSLYEKACEQRTLAYAPHSNFQVGAGVETVDGQVFTGCNVENDSFGLSMCAERLAIFKAVSAGCKQFRRIVIVASPIAAPCGACRQVMSQFFADDAEIIAVDAGDDAKKLQWTMRELLPDRFRLG